MKFEAAIIPELNAINLLKFYNNKGFEVKGMNVFPKGLVIHTEAHDPHVTIGELNQKIKEIETEVMNCLDVQECDISYKCSDIRFKKVMFKEVKNG